MTARTFCSAGDCITVTESTQHPGVIHIGTQHDGQPGSAQLTVTRGEWEAFVAGIKAEERDRIYAELGNEHFVIFTKDRWTVEHSVECRLSGHMHECEYHSAVQRDPDDARARAGYGRFHLTVNPDGWPELEEVSQ
jgi:hypothetical protein